MLDVLIVAPHPDDAELGMGGAIQRFQAEGLRVGVLDLTSGEPTPFGDPETRKQETAEATRILGLKWRQNLGLPNRSLVADLEGRRAIAGVIRQTKPKWVFAPYWEDSHPDHVAATRMVEDARFWAKLSKSDIPGEPCAPPKLLYYFCIHLRLAFQPAFVLDVSPYYETKRAAILAYRSQFVTGRSPAIPFIDRLRDEDAHWGYLIGAAYGEPFASREPIGLSGLGALV